MDAGKAIIDRILQNNKTKFMRVKEKLGERVFTSYQVFVIVVLSLLQFTVILDFMVLSPLGAILMEKLNVTTAQFGLVVSAYAFSAGASGLLTAGFADKFDRKKILLFFYTGFILGTVLCAMAPSYQLLLGARIITGIFGGVIGSVSFAIITDLFEVEKRGRVMGFVQMSFAASQVMGLPIGLYLANHFGWHAPFWMIAGGGSLLVQEAGGIVGDFEGNESWLKTGNIVAANPKVFSQMLQTISPHVTADLKTPVSI